MIVLDTSVMSRAFRRSRRHGGGDSVRSAVSWLIADDWPIAVPGIVYQELLTGVRTPGERARLLDALSGFTVLIAQLPDHQMAAEISSTCRRAGVSTSAVDCLIAAQTVSSGSRLYTVDTDFDLIAQHSDLKLFQAEGMDAPGQRGAG